MFFQTPDNHFIPIYNLTRLLVPIPIAIVIGLVAFIYHPQYEEDSNLFQATFPMIAVFTIAYLLAALFLSGRPTNLNEDRLSITILTLALVYSFATSVTFFFRLPYSLFFVVIFIAITSGWALRYELKHAANYEAYHYLLAQVGNWNDAHSGSLNMTLVSDPNALKSYKTGMTNVVLVIDSRAHLDSDWTKAFLEWTSKSVPVIDVATLYEYLSGRVSVTHFTPEELNPIIAGSLQERSKRIIDVVISSIAISVLFIPLLLIALIIRIGTPGTVIYTQTRIGKHGRVFTLYKLRTMKINSEDEGPRFAELADPRITSIGKWLRKGRIDEWPQFWNVLKGDMSLVGPRPERPEWIDLYRDEIPHYEFRHIVRPGITGWAQIMQGYASTSEETKIKLEYDLFYIKHFGMLLDIKIILTTLLVIGVGSGAK